MDFSEIINRLDMIEKRIGALEKDSHPPVDLTQQAYLALHSVMIDAAEEAIRKAKS